jgi:hypothetical protein
MLTISIVPRGYAIKLSEPGLFRQSMTFVAPDLKAVHLAIDHYYVNRTARSPSHQRKPRKGCPLCEENRLTPAPAPETLIQRVREKTKSLFR